MESAQLILTVFVLLLVALGGWYGIRRLLTAAPAGGLAGQTVSAGERATKRQNEELSDRFDRFIDGDEMPTRRYWSASALDLCLSLAMATTSTGILLTWLVSGDLGAVAPVAGLPEASAAARLVSLIVLCGTGLALFWLGRRTGGQISLKWLVLSTIVGVVVIFALSLFGVLRGWEMAGGFPLFLTVTVAFAGLSHFWWRNTGRTPVGISALILVLMAGVFCWMVHPDHMIGIAFLVGSTIATYGRVSGRGTKRPGMLIYGLFMLGMLGLTAWISNGLAALPIYGLLLAAGFGVDHLMNFIRLQSRESAVALPLMLAALLGAVALVFLGLQLQVNNEAPRLMAPWGVVFVLLPVLVGLFLWFSAGFARLIWRRGRQWQWLLVLACPALAGLLAVTTYLALLAVNGAGFEYGATAEIVPVAPFLAEFVTGLGLVQHWWAMGLLALPLLPLFAGVTPGIFKRLHRHRPRH